MAPLTIQYYLLSHDLPMMGSEAFTQWDWRWPSKAETINIGFPFNILLEFTEDFSEWGVLSYINWLKMCALWLFEKKHNGHKPEGKGLLNFFLLEGLIIYSIFVPPSSYTCNFTEYRTPKVFPLPPQGPLLRCSTPCTAHVCFLSTKLQITWQHYNFQLRLYIIIHGFYPATMRAELVQNVTCWAKKQ